MSKHEWTARFNELDGEWYFEKLVNMSEPKTMSLDEAAEYINKLENTKFSVELNCGVATVMMNDVVMNILIDGMTYEQRGIQGEFIKEQK